MIEETMCPTCFGIDTEHICDAKIENTDESRPLHKCNQCGSFFWHDTGEKIQWLSRLCETKQLNRKRCNKAILNFKAPSVLEDSMQKIFDALDKICVECPNKKFILKAIYR